MNDRNSSYNFAKLRDEIHQNPDVDLLRDAGLIDPELANHLERFRKVFRQSNRKERRKNFDHYREDKTPEKYFNTRFYRSRINKILNEELEKSVRNKNHAKISRAVGLSGSEKKTKLKNWQKIEKLKDLFRQEPLFSDFSNNTFQSLIFSNKIPPTGRGKTSTAYLLIEFFELVAHDNNPKIWTNNVSDDFDDLDESWNGIKNQIREHDGEGLVLIDDASVFLQYTDQTSGKMMSQELKLLRKNNTHIILITHTGRDVPADLRRQLFVINKRSEKKAELGYGIDNGNDDRMVVNDVLMELEDIPHTSISYEDVDDFGFEIKFDDNENNNDRKENNSDSEQEKGGGLTEKIEEIPEELTEKEKAVILYQDNDDNVTQQDLADHFDVSRRTISNWING